MAKYKVHIDFRKYTSHPQLVQALSRAYEAIPGDEVEFSIILKIYSRFLYSDFLLLIVATVRHLLNNGVVISGVIEADDKDEHVKYASRVNFFQQLEVAFAENFVRHSGTGKFTEIETFDKDSIYRLQNELNLILHQSDKISVEVLQMLYWCLNEVMDNVLLHSQLFSGWVCAQLFPRAKEIRMIICDTGVGIHKSMTHETSKYKHATEQEALTLCIQNRVTSGAGMGFGLYATSEFIKENAGELIIYSGNYYLQNTGKQFHVYKGNFWQGTFVYLKINTDIPVDYRLILPKNHSLSADYQEFIDKMLGIDENLW